MLGLGAGNGLGPKCHAEESTTKHLGGHSHMMPPKLGSRLPDPSHPLRVTWLLRQRQILWHLHKIKKAPVDSGAFFAQSVLLWWKG